MNGNGIITTLMALVNLSLSSQAIPLDLPNKETLYVVSSEAHCDNGKHTYIKVKDLLDRDFELRYGFQVNACITTEHYLNGNLSKEEFDRILYDN